MTPDHIEIDGVKYVRERIWLEAERELSAVSSAIGSVRWMDPPDGGDVTLAEQVARMRTHMERLEEALTPSSDTKADYIGEFQFTVTTMELDESDEPYESQRVVTVPWVTIKEIMSAIRDRAGRN